MSDASSNGGGATETPDRHEAPARPPRRLVDDRRARAATGAYETLRKVLGEGRPDRRAGAGEAPGLRGRGGAGLRAPAQKWSFLPADVVPALPRASTRDEGEPSTFKDRMLLERDPHQLIEGIIDRRVRDPVQPGVRLRPRRVRARLRAARPGASPRRVRRGLPRHEHPRVRASTSTIVVHRGAGAYICGEETGAARVARGRARHAADQAAVPRRSQGLYAKPTRRQQRRDALDRPAHHRDGRRGVRRDRREPLDRHTHLLGLGPRRTARQLRGRARHDRSATSIYGLAGGVRGGRKLKFFIPGGASSPVAHRRDEHLDAPLDMDFVQQSSKSMLGSGRGHGVRRDRRPAARSRGGSRSSSRTSRAASARRAARARAGSRRCSTAWRTGRAAPRTSTCCSSFGDNISPGVSNAPFAQTTICPLGPQHDEPRS